MSRERTTWRFDKGMTCNGSIYATVKGLNTLCYEGEIHLPLKNKSPDFKNKLRDLILLLKNKPK